jgi:hypothetical protein
VHGLIHALGFVQGLRLAVLAPFHQPIGPAAGLLWLAARDQQQRGGALLLVGARRWWAPALAGVVLSQMLVVSAWQDAKYGMVANAVVLVASLGVLFGVGHGGRGGLARRGS